MTNDSVVRFHVEGQTSTKGARWQIWDGVDGHFARFRNITDEGDARAVCAMLNDLWNTRTPLASQAQTIAALRSALGEIRELVSRRQLPLTNHVFEVADAALSQQENG